MTNNIFINKKFKALIFDLDGVVVDTAKYHYLAWKKLAKQLEYDFNEKDNELFKGVSRMRCMEILADIAGIKLAKDEMERLADIKNTWYLEYISNMKSTEILPGFKEFIVSIKESGIKTSLASASKNAGIVLDRLEIRPYFDAIVDGNDVKNSKPDPEVFLIAAQRLGIENEYCVVFEDAQAGIDAAKAAGMACVGIGDPDILTGADMVITGFEDHRIQANFVLKERQGIIYA